MLFRSSVDHPSYGPIQRRIHQSASSVHSRPSTKRGRFNEDYSQHLVAPPRLVASSSVQNRLKLARSLSKQHSEAMSEISRQSVRRPREDTHSEKAESIKSRLIEAISRMDDTDLDKLRSVLKLEQNTEMAGRLIKLHPQK